MRYSCLLSGGEASWSAIGLGLKLSMNVSVPGNDNCELREISVINIDKQALECELVGYFEPVLAPAKEFDAHPAFSKLFLRARAGGICAMVSRRSRSGGQDYYLAFACSEETVWFNTAREGFLGRGGLIILKTHFRTIRATKARSGKTRLSGARLRLTRAWQRG
jgi:cyclic beta-1,2-glucan synthetase